MQVIGKDDLSKNREEAIDFWPRLKTAQAWPLPPGSQADGAEEHHQSAPSNRRLLDLAVNLCYFALVAIGKEDVLTQPPFLQI